MHTPSKSAAIAWLLLIILAVSPGTSIATKTDKTAPENAITSTKPTDRYAGYQVDGRTTASVLAAKRSHTVSERDETGLAIYSGIFMIGLILFFVQLLQKPK